jgi:predicted nucleic acid-binding protein
MEVAHYLIKNMGSDVGRSKMDLLLSYPMEIMNFDQYLARRSVEYLAKYSQTGIGGRDATILASKEELEIKKLMTHDRAFKRLDFIEIVDPIV